MNNSRHHLKCLHGNKEELVVAVGVEVEEAVEVEGAVVVEVDKIVEVETLAEIVEDMVHRVAGDKLEDIIEEGVTKDMAEGIIQVVEIIVDRTVPVVEVIVIIVSYGDFKYKLWIL